MRSLHYLAIVMLAVASPSLCAARPVAEVHAALVKHMPGLKVEDVRQSKVPGLFEVRMGEGSAYVSEDGLYLVKGDLFEIANRTNLSEAGRTADRRELLTTLDPKQVITFSPANPKHTITVFTDIECGYCRKLHSEIAQINALGIAVRYVAYPRGGPNTEAWTQMEAVWCSPDQQGSLTRAKLGNKIERAAGCTAAHITSQYQLGQKLGIQGTPLVVLENGRIVGGYIPPQELAKVLDARPQATAASR